MSTLSCTAVPTCALSDLQLRRSTCSKASTSFAPRADVLPRNRKQVVHSSSRDQNGTATKEEHKGSGLGDLLGPIGLTLGGAQEEQRQAQGKGSGANLQSLADSAGVSLGPIGLTYGDKSGLDDDAYEGGEDSVEPQSISSLTTAQWREQYERNGCVDLWLEEEFNSGSRLVGGRAVHKGKWAGIGSGEGRSLGSTPSYRVVVHNHYAAQTIEVDVPEDRYILWEAEDQGLQLPYACRMGCCTACAVRVKEGSLYQPQALGISAELKEQNYALMCVAYPRSDVVLETVPEDEVYELQFGESFAQQALDPYNPQTVKRDDFALEIADMDE